MNTGGASAEFSPIIERKGPGRIKVILCGQEPVMEMGSSAKMAELESLSPGIVERFGPNSWMQTIARAAGILDKRGEVDVIIPSGRRRGEVIPGQTLVEPTEASMMEATAEKVYGVKAPQSDDRFLHSEVWLETEARNTIYNIINAVNLIDKQEPGKSLAETRDSTYIIGAHYQVPRLKLLASYFGFDPSHILSAEEVMLAQSEKQLEATMKLPNEAIDKSDEAFIKSKSMINWLKARTEEIKLGKNQITYYQRKAERARKARAKLIDRILDGDQAKSQAFNREARKAELEQKLFIYEGKDIGTRMREERRWVRGLIEVPDVYFIPLAMNLENEQRLKFFLGRFDKEILAKVGLEDFAFMTKQEIKDKLKDKWDWRVVKPEWENEEYPEAVKEKMNKLGLSEEEVEHLSKGEVLPLMGNDGASQNRNSA